MKHKNNNESLCYILYIANTFRRRGNKGNGSTVHYFEFLYVYGFYLSGVLIPPPKSKCTSFFSFSVYTKQLTLLQHTTMKY
jgi:hypothetical protein